MPYVAPLAVQDAPEKSRPVLQAIEKNFGQSLNIFSTAAHQPDVLAGLIQINDGIGNDLPAKLRELAYCKSSQAANCNYCLHYHKQAAQKTGVTAEQLDALANFESSDAFDEQEKSVLAYAQQLSEKAQVDASIVKQLKEFLNDKQLVSLAAVVALANFTARFNHGLNIQLP